eukprot:4755265-Pyramimonas_sp.AAC.1
MSSLVTRYTSLRRHDRDPLQQEALATSISSLVDQAEAQPRAVLFGPRAVLFGPRAPSGLMWPVSSLDHLWTSKPWSGLARSRRLGARGPGVGP